MKKFWLDSLIITVFVFFMLWVAGVITDLKIFNAFDPIGQAIKDFELTDYVFSQIREDPKVDSTIVLVNIGSLPRGGLAREIMLISQQKPRVIGFDGFFDCEGGLRDTLNCPQLLDTLGNLMLSDAIKEAGNVVLGSKLLQTAALANTDNNDADSLEISDPMFDNYSTHGFVTLPTDATYQEDVKIARTIYPSRIINGKRELAWSVQLAMQYDSTKTNKFLARGNDEELINFRGNIEVRQLRLQSLKNDETATTNFKTMFFVVDAEDLLSGNVQPDLFKDRIVMMGYLGDYLGQPAWEDKFFTPLNKKVAGRANPDMFGLVVHANSVAMVLNEDYINETPDWLEWAIAFVVCLLTVGLFAYIDTNLPIWFDALSVFIQLVELLLITIIIIQAFALWSVKLDLTVAIGVSALVGPAYDVFKSIQNQIQARLTKAKPPVSTG